MGSATERGSVTETAVVSIPTSDKTGRKMQAKSLGDMLRQSCARWAAKPAMLHPDKEGHQPVTYAELWQKVRGYAGAIRSLGIKKGDRVAIQSESCIEWALADWACQCLGVILVPIYPTLPEDQTQYIVRDCGAQVVLASTHEQADKVANMPGIECVLLRKDKNSLDALAQVGTAELSEAEFSASIDAIGPDDLATIIYTSGTTGPPKGAMLSHSNIIFVCESAVKSMPVDENDIFLSFLPMSHVYERVAGQALPISCGATIAYAKSLMSLAHDMMFVRPTIMLCVPRFLEATRDRIIDSAAKSPLFRRLLFKVAMWACGLKAAGKFSPLAPVFNGLVGKRIRERTGGRIKFFVSGGAALAPVVANFYRGFGLDVLQGYGLTETTAATCVNHPDRNEPWTVGEPLEGVEVRVAFDGEILVRGPSRMIGYYNLPKETEEAVDKDGWFHTGDIGKFEGKHLRITDRKKDLLILANGKNIAPQPIENKLRESPFITEAVLLGDGKEFVFALIVPNWERVRAELHSSETNASLAERDSVRALIRAEIEKVNKTLADFEKVRRHKVLNAEFSIETGELTPSLKVKRKFVKEKYKAAIEELLD